MLIKYYQEEQDAKIALSKLDKTPKEFCPLIKDICRIDCLCYVEAYVAVNVAVNATVSYAESLKYHINRGYCNNEMFTGA